MKTQLKTWPILVSILLSGCFDSGNDSESSTSTGSRIKLAGSVNGQNGAAARVAPSGEDGLQNFQVAIADISIAKNLTPSGSGFSGLLGVLNLYRQDLGDFNRIDSTLARDPAWRSHYIDFCDPSSLSKLAKSIPFTLRDTGSYGWVVVNWAPFFRLRATIPFGTDTAYTKDGGFLQRVFPNTTPENGTYYITQSSTSLLQGPSEFSIVRKNNGGTWFRFLRPLRLTPADLDTNQRIADTVGRDSTGKPIVNMIPSGRWNVLMVFNPKDLVFAGANDSTNSSVVPDIRSPDSSTYLHVPFLKATAIPYRDGEIVMRETYEFDVNIDQAWAKGIYGMRLELYLIGDNVVASTVLSYPKDQKLSPPDVPVIFFVEESGDRSLDLEAYDHTPVFQSFARKTTVGQTGTVHWNPSAMGQDAQNLSYRLSEIKRMN